MFAFLGSAIGRYVAIAGVILSLAVGAYVFYLKYKNLQQANELLRYNQVQLEQNLKDKEQFLRNLEEIAKKKDAIIVDLKKANEEREDRVKTVIEVIEKHTDKERNKPASKLLKDTIRELGKMK